MRFERLPGLPSTGPYPEQFPPGVRHHREGVVVRFLPDGGEPWVGNFQRGLTSFDAVVAHPDGRRVVAVSGGAVFLVDPSVRSVAERGGAVVGRVETGDPAVLVFDDQEIRFFGFRADGREWRTRRISFEGFREVRVEGDWLLGDSWDIPGNRWVPFSADLFTGAVDGGSWPEDLPQ